MTPDVILTINLVSNLIDNVMHYVMNYQALQLQYLAFVFGPGLAQL